jgi:hypothetical protein
MELMSYVASEGADAPIRLGRSATIRPMQIFDALDEVFSLHQAGESRRLIVGELDRLLELARSYFREQEADGADDFRPGRHPGIHELIIDYIANLRCHADRFEQVQLLPQLRFLDYWLTTCISERFARRR